MYKLFHITMTKLNFMLIVETGLELMPKLRCDRIKLSLIPEGKCWCSSKRKHKTSIQKETKCIPGIHKPGKTAREHFMLISPTF